MPVTTTIIPSNDLTEAERTDKRQHEINLALIKSPPPINERPTELERRRLPGSQIAAVRVRQARNALTNASAKESELREKGVRLGADIDRYSSLATRLGEMTARKQNAEAKAILAEMSADTAELQGKLAAIEGELSSFGNIASIKRAKAMVEARLQATTAQIVELRKELAVAEQAWVALRHAQLTEDLRHELQGLHRRIAVLLALEASPGFPQYKANAWKFVEGISSGVPYRNELFPDWANSAKPEAFPRFADAKAQIRAKLDTLDGDE